MSTITNIIDSNIYRSNSNIYRSKSNNILWCERIHYLSQYNYEFKRAIYLFCYKNCSINTIFISTKKFVFTATTDRGFNSNNYRCCWYFSLNVLRVQIGSIWGTIGKLLTRIFNDAIFRFEGGGGGGISWFAKYVSTWIGR